MTIQIVHETRSQRLHALKTIHGSWASLNEAAGLDRTSPRLAQVANGAIRADRGQPYRLGDEAARQVEAALGLAPGWLDTPAQVQQQDPGDIEVLVEVRRLLSGMSIEQQRRALQVLKALV